MATCKALVNAFLLVVLSSSVGKASTCDSTLIGALKAYIQTSLGYKIRDQFFSTWSEGGKPAVVVYISPKNSVGSLGKSDIKTPVIGTGYDELAATMLARRYDSLGYHTLVYKTYGTGRTELSPRLLSYSSESISFIVLHEYVHHFTVDHNVKVPYEYQEALGDVVGNYGTIEFSRQSSRVKIRNAKEQRKRNERLYRAINKSIVKISNDSTQVTKVNDWCRRRIDQILRDDLFQDDRFNYTVNNAYLFRYRAYTEKYFTIKKVLKKQKSVQGLLRIIEKAPNDSKDFEKYLREL